MAPKKKGKKTKKSKEQLEEERLAAEEAARVAAAEEAHRLEEERKAREIEETKLRKEEEERLRIEGEKLSEQRNELTPFLRRRSKEIFQYRNDRALNHAWKRYLSCSQLPNPASKHDMTNYEASPVIDLPVGASGPLLLEALIAAGNDVHDILEETRGLELEAIAIQAEHVAKRYQVAANDVKKHLVRAMDAVTSVILQRPDEYADERNEVQLVCSDKYVSYGLWVNMNKNPRLKYIEMADLDLTLELPKSLALATVALRVSSFPCEVNAHDIYSECCCNEYMAASPVFKFDLLGLSAPPKSVKSWTVRHVPAAGNGTRLTKLAYPIPPAGTEDSAAGGGSGGGAGGGVGGGAAAAAAQVSGEQTSASLPGGTPSGGGVAARPVAPVSSAPPLGVTMPLSSTLVLLPSEPLPIVACWDAFSSQWVTEGVSDVRLEGRQLSFLTSRLAPVAVVRSRVSMVPFTNWHLFPASLPSPLDVAKEGGEVMLTVYTAAFPDDPFVFCVNDDGVALQEPKLPELDSLLDVAMASRELLLRLSACGLHLLPQDSDVSYCPQAKPKLRSLEKAAFEDLTMLCASFMVSRSKWNTAAGSEAAIFRVAEVTDDGRTNRRDVERVFSKESAGVKVLMRQEKGVVAIEGAKNKDENWSLEANFDNKTADFCALSYLLLKRNGATEDGIARIDSSSAVVSHHVTELMNDLRLLSFS